MQANRPTLQVAKFPRNARCAVTTSWDDNDSGSMEIMKILDSMNLKGTFYVDAGNRHGTPGWASDGLEESDLRALSLQHEVGSHTWSHVNLRRCDARGVREELIRSKDYLERTLGQPVFGFAYPYGAYTPLSQRVAKECGYLFARTGVQGAVAFPPSNPYLWGIGVWALAMSPNFILKQLLSKTGLSRVGRMYFKNLAWDWRRLTSVLFEKARLANGVLHICGHAVEVLEPKLRKQFVELCGRLAFRDDVWYATNKMLFLNDLFRNNVHVYPGEESDARSIFSVCARRPPGISCQEYPIPLRVSVPEAWKKDFAVEIATVSGKAKFGKHSGHAWIDIYGDEAKVTVSRG
jgi:peptidoglycan/xylan/chitin deacetylase (PgdA/CDA1 family)